MKAYGEKKSSSPKILQISYLAAAETKIFYGSEVLTDYEQYYLLGCNIMKYTDVSEDSTVLTFRV
jgi:hypothetical protein